MSGIKAIDFSKITGRVIINLDCSDQGIVVGCAGSAVIRLVLPVEREAVPGNWECGELQSRESRPPAPGRSPPGRRGFTKPFLIDSLNQGA